jgi:hypothetical protein
VNILKIKVDKETRSIELLTRTGGVITLTKEESVRFFTDFENVKEEYGHLFVEFEEKITLNDLQEKIKENHSADFLGINFFGERLLRVDHVSFYAEAVFDGASDDVFSADIHDNFSKGYLWEGYVSNFDIRNCLSNDLIEFLKDHPEYYVSFDGVNITTEVLFDDKRETYYLDESYDT